MKTGVANLPLHYGSAPRWLFERMAKLAREITIVIVDKKGPDEFLQKISDPFWFQAFGCVLGFDWHSSGVTTTVGGALKVGLRDVSKELGIFVAGGKGGTSRKTPDEIEIASQKIHLPHVLSHKLIYASKMSAKVDTAGLQDGYQLYHHNFIFTKHGKWAVVQQGMNTDTRWARRYHWLSDEVSNFVCQPHKAVCSDNKGEVLNMVARESHKSQLTSYRLARQKPEKLANQIKKLKTLNLPRRESILVSDLNPDSLRKIFVKTYESQPASFENLLATGGVGPKTIRALALISELIYNVPYSMYDPVRYSFAHGGKDGTPYPVNRKTYDSSIAFLHDAVVKAKIGRSDKLRALEQLSFFYHD
ncbi:hypothetical protein A2Z23_01430 [Candidatus Curtissbacteria bacterium RBG_16_39_7]|uniref:DUF763 domain-containing protein n=1 Tax=Candidatus Curtissbacteria bacterium RBG_16_39_7 TaxID=1797707 RepID=A0A1F5G4W3_9BACT|nr:MAG: hypothetical protein A2Z23_01430 [Candidatus Curtissbacteria bacterium RBG_16_39_7]